MKKIIISSVFALMLFASGCAAWTDIEPKGTNMLQKVSDIDMLLNFRFWDNTFICPNSAVVMNDMFPDVMNKIYQVITMPTVNPLKTAFYSWDETIDRAAATGTDAVYTSYYGVIGKVCNPVLLRADGAKGDRATANRLKAEAYVLRAYYHYLLVNLYAKAYDPATAAADGGVPYSRETDLPSVPNKKCTVQEVYNFIQDDLKAAFELNSLAAPSANRMRVNSAFAHAVQAKVLMSLRDYDGAAREAAAALAIEGTIDDHNTMLVYDAQKTYNETTDQYEAGYSFTRPEMTSAEDLFYASGVFLLVIGIPAELAESFEPGSIFFRHTDKTEGSYYWGVEADAFYASSVFLNPGGLSTVDMYMTQAECLIRKGDATSIGSAMDIINNIRRKRTATDVYNTTAAQNTTDKINPADFYTPLTAANSAEAIAHLKRLTRNENWYGPKRFISMKRWNTEDAWKETLSKHVVCVVGTGTEEFDFTLAPGSPLWIFPFPSKSTSLNPNLTQNY